MGGVEPVVRNSHNSPRITVQGNVNTNNYIAPLAIRNAPTQAPINSPTPAVATTISTTNRMNGAYSSLPVNDQEADVHYIDDTSSLIQNGTTGSLSNQQIAQVQSSSVNTQGQTIKYVCCGSCHQWLTAPVESRYVFCPTCEHVNACPQTPTLPATRPVYTQDSNDSERQTVPWLLLPIYDCMRGMLR